jgi:hypothetical protein
MRLSLQAVVPTFNQRRPISQDGKGLALPRTVPGAGTFKHATIDRSATPFDTWLFDAARPL